MERVTIGFVASPPLGVRLTSDALAALLGALGSDGWHDLEADDGNVKLNLQTINYVRTEKSEPRVGFGTS